MTEPYNASYDNDNLYSHNYRPEPDNTYSYNESSSVPNKKQSSNWPEFLIEPSSQTIYGLVSLVLSFFVMYIPGAIAAIYYLFILDNSHEKTRAGKIMNWCALILPIIFFILFFIFFFFVFAGLAQTEVSVN